MNQQQLFNIKIEGYKSIKECNLNLGMINVLIGANGAGKSNFISIFKLFQDIIEKKLQLHVAEAGGANTLLYDGRKVTSEIKMEFNFGNNGYMCTLVPTDDNKLIFATEQFAYTPHHINKFYIPIANGHEESKWQIGTNTRYDQYVQPILEKEKWRVYHFHDTSRSAKVKQMHKVANCAELLYDAGNLAAFLLRLRNNYAKSYDMIVQIIQLIAPYFQDFYLEPSDNGEDISLRWKQKSCDDIFNANQLSDGTLRFICLTTLLMQPENLQPETIIIDEPELGLHPYAISIFAEMVKNISTNKQIILSTQSVELLNEFDIGNIVVVNRSDNGTNFNRLTEEELKIWLDSDYSLGDLWKKNVIGGRFS